jgi:hypothetical protein
MRLTWMAAFLGLVATSQLRADIPVNPRPKPPSREKPAQEANIIVVADASAQAPKLIVPQKIVVRKAELDGQRPGRLADNEPSRPWGQTILAGTALTLAVSFAGLWMVRRGQTAGKRTALLIAAGVFLTGSAIVWANAALPVRPKPTANQEIFSGKIAIEYTAEGDTIKLIVPPDMVAAMARGLANGGAVGAAPNAAAKPE